MAVAYDGDDILSDVDLEIPVGEITAIIGGSGSGKSSLVDLVTGLAEPRVGRVLVDDTPLSELDLAAWRHRIGYVPQDLAMLHDSIRVNVGLGDPDIDDARSFLMQNFWYNQSLSRISFVEGVTPSSIAAPAHNFAGAEYLTDGSRVVLFVSEKPVAMDETAVAPRLNSKSE